MKRWIIRSFFIGLLLLCVGTWGVSYFYQDVLSYHANDSTRLYRVRTGRGNILLYAEAARVHLDGFFDGWQFGQVKINDAYLPEIQGHDVLGFGVDRHPEIHPHLWLVIIPFYFPTTISAALPWLAWRKTRPKAKGRAFPVELAKPNGQK